MVCGMACLISSTSIAATFFCLFFSFLFLDEAVGSHKKQLMKLLDSISEQKNSVRSSMQDLDGR